MAFPILPGMDFTWVDPEGTPNRRWRAVMSREVWQQVVNIKLYGGHPPPAGTPQLFVKKPRQPQASGNRKATPEINKKRRMRRLAEAKANPATA